VEFIGSIKANYELAGFLGVAEQKVEMLFLEPKYHGKDFPLLRMKLNTSK
jgi:hypothetical protein